MAMHLSRERLRQLAALLGVELEEAALVALERGIGRARRLVEDSLGGARQRIQGEKIEGVLSLPAIADEPALAEPSQVRGHSRLRDPRHMDEVGHAELALAEKRAETDAALIAEEIQRSDIVGEAHVSAYDDARMHFWAPERICQGLEARAPAQSAALAAVRFAPIGCEPTADGVTSARRTRGRR